MIKDFLTIFATKTKFLNIIQYLKTISFIQKYRKELKNIKEDELSGLDYETPRKNFIQDLIQNRKAGEKLDNYVKKHRMILTKAEVYRLLSEQEA